MTSKGKQFSNFYFKFEKTIKDKTSKYIEEKTGLKKNEFVKVHKKEPSELDIKLIKKDIVMKNGLMLYGLVALIVFIAYVLLKG